MDTEDSEFYLDREQSQIKHEILKSYLQRFALIVGRWREGIIYVDGFSGPWNTVSEDFEDSSFSIALTELLSARQTLREKFGKTLNLKCIFLEKDSAAFKHLKSYADRQSDAEILAVNETFEKAIPQIKSMLNASKRDHFPFILIDPKGWKGFAMDVIKPVIQVQPSEVLVNFMTGHIIRFVEDQREGLKESFRKLYGDNSYEKEIVSLCGREREDAIVETYARRLAEEGRFPHYSVTIVLQPTRDRTHFHLVYATRDLKGIEVFKEAERKALKLSETVRADAKRRAREQASGQNELFGGETMPDVNYLAELQVHYEAKAEQELKQLVRGVEEIDYDSLYAHALRHPLVQEAFLRKWIKEIPGAETSNLGTKKVPKIRQGHRICFKKLTSDNHARQTRRLDRWE